MCYVLLLLDLSRLRIYIALCLMAALSTSLIYLDMYDVVALTYTFLSDIPVRSV